MTEANVNNQPVGIIRQTTTVSITFVEKPSEELRRQLRESGFRYENGNWYRSQTDGQMATEELVAQVLAA